MSGRKSATAGGGLERSSRTIGGTLPGGTPGPGRVITVECWDASSIASAAVIRGVVSPGAKSCVNIRLFVALVPLPSVRDRILLSEEEAEMVFAYSPASASFVGNGSVLQGAILAMTDGSGRFSSNSSSSANKPFEPASMALSSFNFFEIEPTTAVAALDPAIVCAEIDVFSVIPPSSEESSAAFFPVRWGAAGAGLRDRFICKSDVRSVGAPLTAQ